MERSQDLKSRPAVLTLLVLVFLLLSLPKNVLASGYHPPLDRAIEEAQLIVLGKVVEAWDPESGPGASDPISSGREGRAYRMHVERTYKGPVKPGHEVVFWDRYWRSSASYFVDEQGTNLTFLVPVTPSEYEKRHLDFGSPSVYGSIRNLSKRARSRAEELEGWLYLLELVRERPPKNRKEAYRNILSTQTNRYVLHYVIEHWPLPMTDSDDLLFKSVIQRHSNDAYITSPALRTLRTRGALFEDNALTDLLRSGSKYQREELLPLITPRNIELCKGILFAWLMEEEPWAEQETIAVLSRLCPEYLKEQLRRRDMPFWKLIPCLRSLKINGSDVGKRDFSPEILSLSPYTIRNIGEVFRGKEFYGVLAMVNPKDNHDWLIGSTLLEPLLSGPDTAARRLAVALMRTFGISVKRNGSRYLANRDGSPMCSPVQLELSAHQESFAFGKPIDVALIEKTTVNTGWISFRGKLAWTIEQPGEGMTMSGAAFGIWGDVDLPREGFVQLKKGHVIRSEHDIASFIRRPGTYRVKVKKTYPHDGQCIGVDAWTGVAFSGEIEIKVVE